MGVNRFKLIREITRQFFKKGYQLKGVVIFCTSFGFVSRFGSHDRTFCITEEIGLVFKGEVPFP